MITTFCCWLDFLKLQFFSFPTCVEKCVIQLAHSEEPNISPAKSQWQIVIAQLVVGHGEAGTGVGELDKVFIFLFSVVGMKYIFHAFLLIYSMFNNGVD